MGTCYSQKLCYPKHASLLQFPPKFERWLHKGKVLENLTETTFFSEKIS